jgi:catechol 2,3-dioxygenase-like lactoylglutathione lyase family enzyme
MENAATSPTESSVSTAARPRFSGFSHASLPCRDLDQSKRFFTEVLGGDLFHDNVGFAEVRIAGAVIGLSEQDGGWTGRDAEYPHYGFFVDGKDFRPMQEWLQSCGIPTHPWTRDHKRALLYFRDPSGNLFEMYCQSGYEGVASLPVGPKQGGRPIDFAGLNHEWNGSNAPASVPRPRVTGLSHISLPCRDVEQSKRFYTRVLGGELALDTDGFAEVRLGGALIGMSREKSGWTGWNAEFPHYAFFAEAEDFLPMIEWLRKNGVNTTEPWTRDGVKGLAYFRDPSGNLLEMYCPKLSAAASFVRGAKQGGSYEIDYAALNYDWKS